MRTPSPRSGGTPRPAVRASVGAGLISLLLVAGCGAAQDASGGGGGSSSTASSSVSGAETAGPSPTPASPSVLADGVTLGALGFTYGPRGTFSLPRTLAISTRVDQPNAVTVVMTEPSLSELADYLRRALPAGGYTITAQDETGSMTFTGQGWTGSVTGDDRVAAVTISPLA